MKNDIRKRLVDAAIDAREKSYSPYSGFSVGAALLTADGLIYTGANIESASYTPTVCAERVAVFSAVHSGERDFVAIAIVGGKDKVDSFVSPCGVCRQVLSEFANENFEIILFDGKEYKTHTLGEMFPFGFGKNDLK